MRLQVGQLVIQAVDNRRYLCILVVAFPSSGAIEVATHVIEGYAALAERPPGSLTPRRLRDWLRARPASTRDLQPGSVLALLDYAASDGEVARTPGRSKDKLSITGTNRIILETNEIAMY